MNTKHYYLRLLRTFALAALTAAATAACSDDTDTDREPLTPPDGIPVTFTANINPGSDADPADAPGTRTVLTPDGGGFTVSWKGKNDYADGCDQILIWAAKDNTLTSQSSTAYVPTTSGVSSELVPRDVQNPLTVPSAGEWTFRAVYGENNAMNGIASVMLSPQPQSAPGDTKHIASQDFSVATATQHVAADSDMPAVINFKFEHKLSALQLHVTNQTGEALTVKEIRLSAAGGQIAYYRAYNVATGDWEANVELKKDYLELAITTPAALASGGTESQDFHMLFFPGYENDTLTVTVITSRGEYSRTRPAPDGGFLAGKNYLTDITIKTNPGTGSGETWTEYITSKADLIAFRNRVNNGTNSGKLNALVTADIDLTNETWTPIGRGNSFQGTFDGGGYHISKLSVDYGSNVNAGLFGHVVGGTVRNLRVSGNVTTTGDNAGGIVGQLDRSTVENCIFSGTVNGKRYVGGIAGDNSNNSRIAGCHTEGTVTATTTEAGGIVGYNRSTSTIDGCYSEAEVTAINQTGGIVGNNYNSSTVTHCYATGKVSGLNNVGGIVGYTNSGTFTGCIALNPGLVRTLYAAVTFGRIAGINYNNTATFTSCAAFEDMTITNNASQPITGATGVAGDNLTRDQCLTKDTYTTRSFAEPTATKPGWAFDTATPWTYLPWNKAFESFPGITNPDEYRIKVPDHLKAPVIN